LKIDSNLLNELSSLILSDYNAFINNATLFSSFVRKYDLHEAASPSDVYYFYQNDIFYNQQSLETVKMKELRKIYDEIKRNLLPAIDDFYAVNYIKQKNVDIAHDIRNIFMWASIHANGSYHVPHHHNGNVLSGVIYVKTPDKSGAIVFDDPRGALPPFGKTFRIVPERGDIILFPSWLVHSVSPTISSDPRISISFNVKGDWEELSDVNQGFVTR
jgi:hypothetical protein